MDTFFNTYYLPKLNQDQISNLNGPVSPCETEVVIKSLPTKIRPGSDDFSTEFYQTFKEGLIPILLKIFHKIETEGILSNSFHKAAVTLIPKPHKNSARKENYRPVSLTNIVSKTLTKYLQTKSKNTSK